MTVDSPETQPTHERLARLERTIDELAERIETLEDDEESDDEMVWVKDRTWHTSDARYHTDPDCGHLNNASGSRPMDLSEAMEKHDLELCAFCGDEWTPGGNASDDPQKNRKELPYADAGPWTAEGDDE